VSGPLSPSDRLAAVRERCGVADRSDLARLIAIGPDILDLLHRLSTGDVKGLRPGEGRPTVLTNPKGRIVERLFVHHFGDDGVLLVAGPGAGARVLAHLRKFTFAEDTGLSDLTPTTAAYAVAGPLWAEAARAAGVPDLPPFGAASCLVGGGRARAARTNGFDERGILVVCERGDATRVESALVAGAESVGGAAIDPATLEAWRVLERLPASGHELTEDHNPLEAGLRDAVSFTKGCYVGQEVVARLNTYDKVSREVVRLDLAPGAPAPAPGAVVRFDGREIGVITSAVQLPGRDEAVALAYLKSREVPRGDAVLTVHDGAAAGREARVSR
jgi:tRNA-modifying protein YgfZ